MHRRGPRGRGAEVRDGTAIIEAQAATTKLLPRHGHATERKLNPAVVQRKSVGG